MRRLVSIHAPVRERLYPVLIRPLRQVSIHAPVRELRRNAALLLREQRFNSRSREGATNVVDATRFSVYVSIHAPVRERRLFVGTFYGRFMFQFTLP